MLYLNLQFFFQITILDIYYCYYSS